MYNFTRAQLVRFYIEVLKYGREEVEACTTQQLLDNIVDGEHEKCAAFNGLEI